MYRGYQYARAGEKWDFTKGVCSILPSAIHERHMRIVATRNDKQVHNRRRSIHKVQLRASRVSIRQGGGKWGLHERRLQRPITIHERHMRIVATRNHSPSILINHRVAVKISIMIQCGRRFALAIALKTSCKLSADPTCIPLMCMTAINDHQPADSVTLRIRFMRSIIQYRGCLYANAVWGTGVVSAVCDTPHIHTQTTIMRVRHDE